MELKFAHTSDWHFGLVQYRKYKRWEDIINAGKKFKSQVIEMIKKDEIDFILHSGDIYDSYHPSSGTFLQLYEILEEIRIVFVEKGMIGETDNSLFFTIRGNHDATSMSEGIKGGNALDALHRLKVITYLNDSTIELKNNVKLYGIGHYGQGIKDKLAELIKKEPLDHDKCNILMVHAGLTEHVRGKYLADISQGEILEKGFAYTCVGHYHIEFLDVTARIGNPGSIEHISRLEWSERIEGYHDTKPWHYVTLKRDDLIWSADVDIKTIKVRPKKWLEVIIKGKSIAEVEKEIESVLKPHLIKNYMIYLDVIGTLPQGLFLQTIFDQLLDEMEGELVYFDYEYKPSLSSDVLNRDFSNEDEIITDFLKLRNIEDTDISSWLRLIKDTASKLSGKTSYKEIDVEVSETIALIEEFQNREAKQ